VLMPSGAIKLFQNQNYANHGWLAPEALSSIYRNKAGYSVNIGIKARVRGTVKNANDHPNGGRNRAVKCSRTP
jgi:ribosomal protein L2